MSIKVMYWNNRVDQQPLQANYSEQKEWLVSSRVRTGDLARVKRT